MNILSFIRVFKNIIVKRVIVRGLEVFAFFSRKRNCEEDIFDDATKKIDFPKVISYFLVQVACLDEQKQGSGEVDNEPDHKPEIGFLVDK
jgi:hypothetical protein